jgi:rubrerythrin
MPDLEGTQTGEHLAEAFKSAATASLRYEYFAQQADFVGKPELARLLRDVAAGERLHALGFLGLRADTGDPVTGIPLRQLEDYLHSAIEGETYEYTQMYPHFARQSHAEGFPKVAAWFETLTNASHEHMRLFSEALENLKA